MVVDCHVHPIRGSDVQGTCDRVAVLAERAGIDRMVLLGDVASFGPCPEPAQVRAANDLTLAWMRRRPQRFLGFCYLSPAHSPAFCADELARCRDAGMCGIKLWRTTESAEAVADLAAAHGLPIVQPARYRANGPEPGELTPADLAALAQRRPELTIIMAHLPGIGERGIADVYDLGNVLVDTAGSPPVAGLVDMAVRELGETRVVFGSDAPRGDFAVQIEQVYGAYLTVRQERLVLGGNAARLLRIEEGA